MDNWAIKILAIDNNQDDLKILRALIGEAFPEATVLSALNGKRGLEIAAKEEPEIILLDIIMPETDGYEICRKLKTDTELCNIPVVFFTAMNSNEESRSKALECGAEGFLMKPINKGELTAQIRTMRKIRMAYIEKTNEYERLARVLEEQKKEKLECKKIEESMLAAQELACIGSYEFDMVTNVMTCTDVLLSICGIKREDFTGKQDAIIQYVHPNDRKYLIEMNGKAISEMTEVEFDCRITRPDGEERVVLMRLRPVFDDKGYCIRTAGIVQDITESKKNKQEIEQSEERFQLLFNKAPLGYQSLDLEGCFIDVNQKWLDTLGYRKEEVIGKWFGDFLSPEYVDRFRQNFPVFVAQGYIQCEFEMQRKDGLRLVIAFDGKIGYGSDGEFKQTHCILQDITNQRKAENALKESEEKYRQLVSQMLQGLALHEIILDAEGKAIDYRFLDVNESFERLTGLKHENIIGKTVLEVLPGTEEYWIEKYGKVVTTGESLVYENYSKELGKYYEISAYSPQEKQFAVVISDISKRKITEIELKQTKDYLEKLINNSNAPIVVWNENYKVTRFNRAFELITGRKSDEVIGKRIDLLFSEEDVQKTNRILSQLKRGENLKSQEVKITHVDGSVKTVLWNLSAVFEDESKTKISYIAHGQDITERKIAEDELRYLINFDNLTGLHNRRYFEEELAKIDKRANLPISIIICDINGLKLINDSFGHSSGDELIKKVANTIKEVCRADDIIARIGGDEFVVILPKTDAIETIEIANRMKQIASKEDIAKIELSISYGYDTKTNGKDSLLEILANAENHMYRHKLYERSSMRSKTIDVIMNTLFEKSNRESQHSNRVSGVCRAIASKMNFEKDDVNKIRIAGLVHDIGKIGIDEKILNKAGKLNDDEWEQIKKHPEIGWRILSSVNEFSELAQFVLDHQEKWDGSGYPNGLKGEEIPLEARIIAVADAYDAMTGERSYRNAFSTEEAASELMRCSGTQFDPEIVDVFVNQVLSYTSDFGETGPPISFSQK